MIKLNNTYLGFTDKFSPMQRTKVETCLDKNIRYHKDIMTYKEYMLLHLQEGSTLEAAEGCTHYSTRLEDYTKPKTEYRINFIIDGTEVYNAIDKTLYSFGLYLQKNNLISDENIISYMAAETSKFEAEEKAITDQKLKEKQEEELHEQQKQEFKTWLENQATSYSNAEKMELSKEIFLDTIGSYRQEGVNELLVCIDNINDPICREELKRRLWSGNKASKKVFSYITGIRLPGTDKGTMEILETIQKEDFQGILQYKKRIQHDKDIRTFYKSIRIPEQHFEECQGEYINKYGLDLFVTEEGKQWNITEGKSGLLTGYGKTKQEAMDSLKNVIERNKEEGMNTLINNAIQEYGISPLYQVKEETAV